MKKSEEDTLLQLDWPIEKRYEWALKQQSRTTQAEVRGLISMFVALLVAMAFGTLIGYLIWGG